MKKLKRMLLIHWHHYEMEMIEFEMINFLTGKTAAGKSTIIDALQLVLLGDTGGGFFNKAANELPFWGNGGRWSYRIPLSEERAFFQLCCAGV